MRSQCSERKGNVYVLDLFVLFVKVPPSATTYEPMEVHAINQVASGREQRKRVTFERGRQVQAKTAIG